LNVGPPDFEDEAPLELDFDLEELATETLIFDEGVVGVWGGASDGRVILWKDELSGVIKTFGVIHELEKPCIFEHDADRSFTFHVLFAVAAYR
jgi:hypothetical protein